MKKLKLDLEALNVESFDVVSLDEGEGTVEANQLSGNACPGPITLNTCWVSCRYASCYVTCQASCYGTCFLSCHGTCLVSCHRTCGQPTCGQWYCYGVQETPGGFLG